MPTHIQHFDIKRRKKLLTDIESKNSHSRHVWQEEKYNKKNLTQ